MENRYKVAVMSFHDELYCKFRCHPHIYEEFLRIMNKIELGNSKVHSIVQNALNLLRPYPELYARFNDLLSPCCRLGLPTHDPTRFPIQKTDMHECRGQNTLSTHSTAHLVPHIHPIQLQYNVQAQVPIQRTYVNESQGQSFSATYFTGPHNLSAPVHPLQLQYNERFPIQKTDLHESRENNTLATHSTAHLVPHIHPIQLQYNEQVQVPIQRTYVNESQGQSFSATYFTGPHNLSAPVHPLKLQYNEQAQVPIERTYMKENWGRHLNLSASIPPLREINHPGRVASSCSFPMAEEPARGEHKAVEKNPSTDYFLASYNPSS